LRVIDKKSTQHAIPRCVSITNPFQSRNLGDVHGCYVAPGPSHHDMAKNHRAA